MVPPATNTDLIREIGTNLTILAQRVYALEAKLSESVSAQLRTEEELVQSRIRLAVAESKIVDLKAARDEKDRRVWMIWMAVIGSLLTLAANVTLTAWKR